MSIQEPEAGSHPRDDKHVVEIRVNTKPVAWDKTHISYEELVKLSGEPVPPGANPGFTITYFNGPREKPEGTVVEGHPVKVVDGMAFSVTPTVRS